MITPEDAKIVETGIKAATSEALRPFTDLITKLFGPAAEEIGLGLGAGLTAWRTKRQVRFWQKTREFISEAGFNPSPVPPKILLPIIQNSSIEDNDDLQDRWAALLTQAADPDRHLPISTAFVDILRQLSPTDALFFQSLHDWSLAGKMPGERFLTIHLGSAGLLSRYFSAIPNVPAFPNMHVYTPDDMHMASGLHVAFLMTIDNLVRLGLLAVEPHPKSAPKSRKMPRFEAEDINYCMTALGSEFLLACRAPVPALPSDNT